MVIGFLSDGHRLVILLSFHRFSALSNYPLLLVCFFSLLMLLAVPECPAGSDDVPGEDGGHAAS